MTIDNAPMWGRGKIWSLALATATAGVIGVGVPAPATAATDAFVALSVGLLNDAPPVGTVGGLAVAAAGDQAAQASLSDCVGNGGHQCVVQVMAENTCGAIASNDFGEFQSTTDISLRRAREGAVAKLANKQGAHLVVTGCSNGQGVLPPAPPPAVPKLGPTASFDPILGGLEAHVTDRSGVAAQCTFVMDDIDRSFGLAANSTFDLKVVPAVPRFRDSNVTISCDNGTRTQTTAHF